MRSGGGAAFCLFTAIMYKSYLGLNGSSYLLAGLASVMLVIPFLFYKYGASIREKLTKINRRLEVSPTDLTMLVFLLLNCLNFY